MHAQTNTYEKYQLLNLSEPQLSLRESNKSNYRLSRQRMNTKCILIDYLIHAITSIFLIIVIYRPNVYGLGWFMGDTLSHRSDSVDPVYKADS